jgi:hypothetical protein
MPRLLLDRSTNQLLPYPRQDDEPVVGLDRTAAYVVQVVRDSEPEYDPTTHYLQPLEPVVSITDPDSDDVNGTATYGCELVAIPAPEPSPPAPRWLEFGIDLALHPGITALWGALPGPVSGALPTALNEASRGNPQLFMGLWQRIMATGAITPELIGVIAALAAEHHLPAEFIAGLTGDAQTD